MSDLCRCRCEGGPFDGQVFEVERERGLPPRVVTITPDDGGEPVRYLRMTPRSPMRPGDPWPYVLAPDPQGRS